MKVRLKVLPDEPRGGAWPPSARAVRCPVKSGNERDPRSHLPSSPAWRNGHNGRTARESGRKVWATVGQYAPNLLGHTRATMVRTMGCDPERGS